MFFGYILLFFLTFFFDNFSKTTFSASSINIGERFFLNGKRINIYSKNLDSEVFGGDLENSFFISSNPQIFDISKYQKIQSYDFKDVLDETKSLEVNAYIDDANEKRFLINLNLINEESFPNLASFLIKDSGGKPIGFESLFLIPIIIEALKKVVSDEGIVVDGNKTTITNTEVGLYGLLRINNNDFSKTATGVDIRAGNKKITIGNSDSGDSVAETGNLTIGNTTGFTHLYGGNDFTIRTANGGGGVLSLGSKNDNSKVNIESGTNSINIGTGSTGIVNIGNTISDTNIKGKNVNIEAQLGGKLNLGNDQEELTVKGKNILIGGTSQNFTNPVNWRNTLIGGIQGDANNPAEEIIIGEWFLGSKVRIYLHENYAKDPSQIFGHVLMVNEDGVLYKTESIINSFGGTSGVVVSGTKTTMTNTDVGINGLIRLNSNDFSKTTTGVDIRAGNKNITIGNSDSGDSVAETGNLTIGNTTGFTHLYGGNDFTIRTASGGNGALVLGYKNDNSKINIESGNNEINIATDSTGNINLGNLTGSLNINNKIINLTNCSGLGCNFQIQSGNNSMRIASNSGDTGSVTLGNNFGNTHLYGKEIWLIARSSGDILIGNKNDNPKVQIESGNNDINIGTNSTGSINIGNSTNTTNVLNLNGKVNINANYSTDGICFNLLLNNNNYIRGYSDGHLDIGNGTKRINLSGSEIYFSAEGSNNDANMVFESGTKNINIGVNSSGALNIGNSLTTTNLSGNNLKFSTGDKNLSFTDSHGTFYIDPGSNRLSIGNYSTGPLILGCGLVAPDPLPQGYNPYTHIYGHEITIASETTLTIGNRAGSYTSGATAIDIGTTNPTTTAISIGNLTGNLVLGSLTTASTSNIKIGKNAGNTAAAIEISTTGVSTGERKLILGGGDVTAVQLVSHFNANPDGTNYKMVMIHKDTNEIVISTSPVLANTVSSRKYKENIKKAEVNLEKFKKLLPVIFDYKKEMNSGKKNQWGLIAEDIYDLGLVEAVEFDENGEIYGLNYRTIFMMLLTSYLNSLEKLENIESRIDNLEEENLNLKKILSLNS